MSQEFEVSMVVKVDFPRDVDMDGNMLWWNKVSLSEELRSWLEDLGFDIELIVKER